MRRCTDCDRCGEDCWEKSWLLGELDICCKCYDPDSDDGAIYQEYGEAATRREDDGLDEAVHVSSSGVASKASKRPNQDTFELEEEPLKKKPKYQTPEPEKKCAAASLSLARKAPAAIAAPGVTDEAGNKPDKRSRNCLRITGARAFEPGSKVWAKLRGFPAWPAKVHLEGLTSLVWLE